MIDKYYGAFANRVSRFMGSVWSLTMLLCLIVASGIYFEFSHYWESRLVTIMGFLAVVAIFFLQRSQQHSDRATHLKLDELVKAVEGARNEVAAVEHEPEEVIDEFAAR